MELKNKRLNDLQFEEMRREVLAQWPTGRQVDFDEAVLYHKSMPEKKQFALQLQRAKEKKQTLVQPRGGVETVEEQLRWLAMMEKEGESDLLPTTIDPLTRQKRYDEVQKLLEERGVTGKGSLGGFPAVNHGVAGCRRIVEQVGKPIQVRFGSPDPRLLAEITLAAGYGAIEGGGISSNIPYTKNERLEQTIAYWQYVDRLIGKYAQAGVILNREPYGPLTGTLVPPCVGHTVDIIEALLAAEQGVKSITVGYGQCGNLVQDVAAIRTLGELTQEYLEKFGYGDVVVTTVLHQWMGGFPQDEAKACGVVAWGATAAALGRATKVVVRPAQEAMGMPTLQGISQSLRCTRQTISMLADQSVTISPQIEREMEMIRHETRCLMERCLQLGDGDIARGVVAAFAAGVLDVPFAPSRQSAGKMLPARDNHGAVRIFNPGALPLDGDSLAYHKEKIDERCRAENRQASFQMVIDDIYAISSGKLVGRPH